jgi:site-specific DNA recombinase
MSRKRVKGYVRISTDEQKNGEGLEVQRQAIQMHCAIHDLELIDIVEDAGFSGSTTERPGLQSIIDDVKNRAVEGVVVYKLDRLTRSLKDLLILHDDLFLPMDCSMISIKEQFDTSTAIGKLFFSIIGGFGEFERSVITERLMDGIHNKAKNGNHATGSIPTGYKSVLEDGKKKMVIDESEAQIIELIFHLRDVDKLSFYQIAEVLNDKGYKPKRSKTGQWRNTSVQYIYQNSKYKGIYTFNQCKKRFDDKKGKNVRELVNQIVVENEALRILQ